MTRIEFCFALDDCLYQETQYKVRSIYYSGHLFLEVGFLDTVKPIYSFKIIEEYMQEIFGLQKVIDWYETNRGQTDHSRVYVLSYAVDEQKVEEIHTLLRMKGYM